MLCFLVDFNGSLITNMNNRQTSNEIQVKLITNENIFLKIYGIRQNAIINDLRGLVELFEEQNNDESFVPRRDNLYVAKIDNAYERVKISAVDDVAKMAYVTLLDVGNSSTSIPFHQVSSFHYCMLLY